MMKFATTVILSLQCPLVSLAYNINSVKKNANIKLKPRNLSDRRRFVSLISGIQVPLSIFAVGTLSQAPPSAAFDNRLDDRYVDRTAQIGVQPMNLGVTSRTSKSQRGGYDGLAPCDGRPNCWCSSTPFEDNPARYIKPWDSSNAASAGSSIADVKKVVDTYEVGQKDIDGGGFRIIEYDQDKGYLYVQFQSYKNGFIDDVEFWYNSNNKLFDIRSASRVGQSDLGVNAKRLEYIGTRLEKEFGWKLNRRKNGSLV